MKRQKDSVEKRRTPRFEIKRGPTVKFNKPRLFCKKKSGSVKSAEIVDISMEGLAFEYEGEKMRAMDYKRLSITIPDGKVKIAKVPFQVVDDHAIGRTASGQIRRCGIQFKQLTPRHRAQIRHLIVSQSKQLQRTLRKPDNTLSEAPLPDKPAVETSQKPWNDSSPKASRYYVELFRR